MTDEQFDRLIEVLERIARSLEFPLGTHSPPPPSGPANMFYCGVCASYYMPGTLHHCRGVTIS